MENKGNPSLFHLAGADGLRAIACLAVLFHHLTQRLAMKEQVSWIQETQAFLLLGSTGVSIFFVLSGFLLSYPFWRQYLGEGHYPDIKKYIFRRAARIIPAYYVVFLICAAVVFIFHIPAQEFWIRFITGLTFTAGFHYVTLFPSEVNGPLWSISFEVFCYALMPLFMLGLFYWTGRKRSFLKALMYWTGVVVFVLMMNQWVHMFFTPGSDQRGWQYGLIGGAKYWIPNYNPVGFFGHFAMGIIASGVAVKLYNVSDKVKGFKKWGGFDSIAAVSLICAAGLIWIMRHAGEFSLSLQNQPYFFPLYALLIAAILSAAPHSIWVGKALDNPFFRYTAKVSFGLYIWHYLVINAVAWFWKKNYQYMGMADLNEWLTVSAAIVAISYVIASASYYFVEKPVLDWAHGRKRSRLVRTSYSQAQQAAGKEA